MEEEPIHFFPAYKFYFHLPILIVWGIPIKQLDFWGCSEVENYFVTVSTKTQWVNFLKKYIPHNTISTGRNIAKLSRKKYWKVLRRKGVITLSLQVEILQNFQQGGVLNQNYRQKYWKLSRGGIYKPGLQGGIIHNSKEIWVFPYTTYYHKYEPTGCE